jgi:hypothetical protein
MSQEGMRLSPASQILSVDEGSGHEATVDIRAVFTLWKDYSVSSSLITEQIFLFANPVAPEILGVRVNAEATSTLYFAPMSDGFPSRSCADAFLFQGEVVGAAGRFPAFPLVSGKGYTMCELPTRRAQESRVLWTMMRAGQSIVVLGPDREGSG